MSVEVLPGGQRRIDRVLAPRFTDGVERLELAELRARREEAEAEEADVSYLRRLLQGRLDILRAELERRSAGGDQDVAGLPAILTDDAPGTFSAVPRVQVPSRAGEHRRRVERLVSDETIARLPELDVEELTRAVEVLRDQPPLPGRAGPGGRARAGPGAAARLVPGHDQDPGLRGRAKAVVDAFTAIVPDLPGLHATLHAGAGGTGGAAGAGGTGGTGGTGGAVDSLAHAIP